MGADSQAGPMGAQRGTVIHLSPTAHWMDLYPQSGQSSSAWEIQPEALCAGVPIIQTSSTRALADCPDCLVQMDALLELGLLQVGDEKAPSLSWKRGIVFGGRVAPLPDTWGDRKWDWEPWPLFRDENIYSSVVVGRDSRFKRKCKPMKKKAKKR